MSDKTYGQIEHYNKSQRILALAAVLEALKDKEETSSREDDIRFATIRQLKDLLEG